MPFGVEISGALGPAATRLWEEVMTAAGAIRDTSLVHWSVPSFRRFWLQRLGHDTHHETSCALSSHTRFDPKMTKLDVARH